MTEVLKLAELAERLKCSISFLRKQWRTLPHFFIGDGRDARGVRFDLNDVLAYLKEKSYECLEGQDKKLLGKQIYVPKKAVQESRLSTQKGCCGMGTKRESEIDGVSESDPFGLFSFFSDPVPKELQAEDATQYH